MEIEFRGKAKLDGTWHYGFYHGNRQTPIIVYEWETPETIFHTRVPVDPKTVGQYTNFDDKNGKKIFVGDRCWDDYAEEYGVVVFDEGKFRFEFDNVVMDLSEVAEDLEVIGNIHDNPELLEVSE